VTDPERDLGALAESSGVHSSYTDSEGRTIVVDQDVVVLLLRALGVPLDHPREAAALLRDQQADAARRVLEPVVRRLLSAALVGAVLALGLSVRVSLRQLGVRGARSRQRCW
jgi:hypothetical protein